MKKNRILLAAGSMAAAMFLSCAPQAMARDQVDWSVTIGSGNAYPPPVVHGPPRVVYQAPVYVAPPPVVQYRPYHERHWRERQWRKHEWRERHHHRHHHHHR